MAWTAMSNAADATVLSAAWLNTLKSNIEFLKGVQDVPNAPFAAIRTTANLGNTTTWYFVYDSGAPYLRYRCVLEAGSCNRFRIYVNGVQKIKDDTTRNATYTWTPNVTGTIDMSAMGLTQGAVYEVYLETQQTGGSYTFVAQLLECANASTF